jgi:hypothetical protein
MHPNDEGIRRVVSFEMGAPKARPRVWIRSPFSNQSVQTWARCLGLVRIPESMVASAEIAYRALDLHPDLTHKSAVAAAGMGKHNRIDETIHSASVRNP